MFQKYLLTTYLRGAYSPESLRFLASQFSRLAVFLGFHLVLLDVLLCPTMLRNAPQRPTTLRNTLHRPELLQLLFLVIVPLSLLLLFIIPTAVIIMNHISL